MAQPFLGRLEHFAKLPLSAQERTGPSNFHCTDFAEEISFSSAAVYQSRVPIASRVLWVGRRRHRSPQRGTVSSAGWSELPLALSAVADVSNQQLEARQ